MSEFLSNFNQEFKPIDTFIDPVSKIRVSNPGNLIDTDFEYGLQPTKWETVELINNTPAFFSKSGDTTISDITGITTNAGTREITVTTAFPHLLDVGIPIRVAGTKSLTADGSYIINATPTPTTFTYLSRANEGETISIFDLYTSIITGEFFQGSQISVSDSEGITTDGASPNSTLTVKTSNKHGFGPKTPFYFLNLNSTVSKEFEAQNSTSLSFDPTNSATAQSFDGSNTLIQTPVDLSNSANTSIFANGITETNVTNSTFTINIQTGDEDNWANVKFGDPLYYEMNANSGYFATNSRGVVFIGDVSQVDSANNTATFQVSATPSGDALAVLSDMQGYFKIADVARTFAGNNVDEQSQILIDVVKETDFVFDGANDDSVGSNPGGNTATVVGFAGETINISGSASLDYYIGAMLKYVTDGTAAGNLTNNATYFITDIESGASPGSYSIKIAELPNGASPNISPDSSTATGSQEFEKIGVSLDRDIVHIKNSFFNLKDMIEYTFPSTGSFAADVQQQFYFVSAAYDQHNYKLNSVAESFIAANGGNVTQTIQDSSGRNYTVHRFTTDGTFSLNVTDAGTFNQDLKFTIAGSGSSFGGATTQGTRAAAVENISVVVANGGRVDIAYPQDSGTNDIDFGTINPIPLQATGGSISDVNIDGTEYRVHTFTSTGTSAFTVSSLGNIGGGAVDYLIVGGGGPGGGGLGGGGGAGGMIDSTTDPNLSPIEVSVQSYPIVVGAGGLGDNKDASIRGGSTNGNPSSALGLTALGGGRGGQHRENNSVVSAGGSGGGAGTSPRSGILTGGTGLQPGSASGGYGNDGGNAANNGDPYGGAGGGGAGEAGLSTTSADGYEAKRGGNGRQSNIDGNNYFYAGGGGGGTTGRGNAGAGDGGLGGGGGGSGDRRAEGVNGTGGRNTGLQPTKLTGGFGGANTGSGGGGSDWTDAGGNHGPGGNGGSGIVIIRYPLEPNTGGI